MRATHLMALSVAAILAAGPALAAKIHYTATLTGAAETPPNTTKGAGTAAVTLDTKTKVLSWTVKYSGLTGPATMAHFHGPAVAGAAAGVQVPLTGKLASPTHGSATLTGGQIGDLKAGEWYVNVHTAANPGGEIRGQVLAAH